MQNYSLSDDQLFYKKILQTKVQMVWQFHRLSVHGLITHIHEKNCATIAKFLILLTQAEKLFSTQSHMDPMQQRGITLITVL